VQDKDGDTALHLLAARSDAVALVRLILAKKPDLSVRPAHTWPDAANNDGSRRVRSTGA
jgi:ankyrin repeat protein